MLFDTWGSLLTEPDYLCFSLPYLQQIITALDPHPVIVFTKGQRLSLDSLTCRGLGIDWTTPLKYALEKTNKNKIIQGNFDPTMLLGNPQYFPEIVQQTLEHTDPDRLIINLGHGILPQTPPDHVHAWLEAIMAYYA